ncbi:MAG: NAD(P)H-dependent oxidoreductase subunit E [Acidimicrobiia bacterium]|nr:NAD(P)H-dependent oxidoreductase subunit E [Acidimicrobiia bacterium]MDX2467513.1 NAD(P)H-dependent oxidoreductase subunit E [Acidimicrobiia bacterium]
MRDVVLSAEETEAINAWSAESQGLAREILGKYPEKRSAVMPLLYVSMIENRYVTNEGMKVVSILTGLTAAQVQAVASFYSMYKREELGDYLVSVCTSISCFLRGADDVLAAVEDESGVPDGETGGEGKFSVEHIECNGACGGAPVVLVNYEMIEGVTPDKARELVKWLRDGGPDVVNTEEMQQLFGGERAFDWGIKELEGAILPIPAFGPYGSVKGTS